MNVSRRAALGGLVSLVPVVALAQITEGTKKVANQAEAIALAEKASLDLIGGESKLPDARPYTASGHGDVWLVISQPVPDPKNPAAKKRSVVIELSAATGEILDLSTAE